MWGLWWACLRLRCFVGATTRRDARTPPPPLRRIDFMRYAWGALVVNQFSDTDILVYGDQTLLQFYGLDHVM